MAPGDAPHTTDRPHGGSRHDRVSRRTLLRTAVAGAAAIPLASRVLAQGTPTPVPPAPPRAISLSSMETWAEPWIWRPSDWPGQRLTLNVIENENPGSIVGYGNPSAILFSYEGSTPGPTIRMRGDEVLLVTLRNLLGKDLGTTPFGVYPDPAALPTWLSAADVDMKAMARGQIQSDFCLGEHTNGVHTIHDTNLHTHGLHVRPGRNPDGTHSDNIILRLIGRKDLEARMENADSPTCDWLRDPEQTSFLMEEETVGFADFEFHVGNVQAKKRMAADQPPQPHPAGTFWYHPHCHGSTHMQVASGMAGFLIVEGDVDEAINLALTGERTLDPQVRTGPYDYIERTMFIQRVFNISQDPDAHTNTLNQGGNASPSVNGDETPATIAMRPGAIERWRVLNGSVDGRGYMRFMVLKGQYAVEESATPNGGVTSTLVKLRDPATNTFTPASRAEVAADKQHLYQLSFDGITLVKVDGDNASYTVKDLAAENAGTENPLDRELTGNPNQAMLANYEACFADATSVKNAFVRPNEVFLAQGNRTDLFFQAPRLTTSDAKGEIYTVLALSSVLHSDDYQNTLQNAYNKPKLAAPFQDIVVSYLIVAEGMDANDKPLPPIADYNVMDLERVLPPVADYLFPITDEEVQIKAGDNVTPADPDAKLPGRAGKFRSHTITYSGWGSGDFPLVTTASGDETAKNFRAFITQDQANGGELESLRYTKIPDTEDYLLLPPMTRTMSIAGSIASDVVDDSDALFPITSAMGRKFKPADPLRPKMLVDTAEEWAIYNYSISLWADTNAKPVGQYSGYYPGAPLLRAEGQAKFAAQPEAWRLQTKGVDHPFHMHQNPYWVMRIEVPDENGNLVNILDAPRWQDVVAVPRNGGRVIFRSRFPDYAGIYVNHCHILLHEDHGMMQVVEATPFADQANYNLNDRVASSDASADDVTAIYPRLDQAAAWRQSLCFVDPSPVSGQTFPGFVPGDPPSGE